MITDSGVLWTVEGVWHGSAVTVHASSADVAHEMARVFVSEMDGRAAWWVDADARLSGGVAELLVFVPNGWTHLALLSPGARVVDRIAVCCGMSLALAGNVVVLDARLPRGIPCPDCHQEWLRRYDGCELAD